MSLNETPVDLEGGVSPLGAAKQQFIEKATQRGPILWNDCDPEKTFEDGWMAAFEFLRSQWKDNMAAFTGAFDTPVDRRRNQDEYAQDCRQRMYRFNMVMTAPQNKQERLAILAQLDGMYSQL